MTEIRERKNLVLMVDAAGQTRRSIANTAGFGRRGPGEKRQPVATS